MRASIKLVRDDLGRWGLEAITLHRPDAEPEVVPTHVGDDYVDMDSDLNDVADMLKLYLENNREPKQPILKMQIVRMQAEYRERTGKEATVLDVPLTTELELYKLRFNDIGDLAGRTATEGARAVFPTFMGLKTVWGAKEFRVRREDET